MNSTLEYATTPLALASLVAILLVGVIKLLVAGKNNSLNRLITHYGFGIVLAFGLLGNAAYLYESYQSSETLVIGTVVDENGKYLPRVMIDTGGHARGMTSDSGDFVLAIPKSRIQPKYSISASLNGYERVVHVVQNESRMFLRFELPQAKFDLNTAMSIENPRLVVGHYMGLPEVLIQLSFKNETTSQLRFRDLTMEVMSPSGQKRRLVQVSSSVELNSPSLPPMPHVYIDPGQHYRFYFRFMEYDTAVQQLAASVQSALQSNSDFRSSGPRIGAQYLDDELTTQLQSAVDSNWFWQVGMSLVSFTGSVDGTIVAVNRAITLSASDIDAMKQIRDHYQAGFGVFPAISLAPIGSAKPGLELESEAGI